MANALYPIGKKAILDGDIDFLTDTIKIQLCDSAYTYSASHNFFDDIGAGGRVGTSAALASKTTTGGAFDAAGGQAVQDGDAAGLELSARWAHDLSRGGFGSGADSRHDRQSP
jgi:hypothetical protein